MKRKREGDTIEICAAVANSSYCLYHFLYPQHLPSHNRACHSDSCTDNMAKRNECMLFILPAPGVFLSQNEPQETLHGIVEKKDRKKN